MIQDFVRRPPWRTTALCVAVGLALAACAVGPDFHAPDAPKVADASHASGFTEEKPPRLPRRTAAQSVNTS